MLLPKFNLSDAEQGIVAMVQPGSVEFFRKYKLIFWVSEVLFVVVDFNIFKEDLV